jgi:hypothetical protein
LPEYRPVKLTMSAAVRPFIDMLVHHSAEQQKLTNPYCCRRFPRPRPPGSKETLKENHG